MRSNDFCGDNTSAATDEDVMADRGDFAALGSEGDVVQAGEMVSDGMGVEVDVEGVF